jgi:hypothetical protein
MLVGFTHLSGNSVTKDDLKPLLATGCLRIFSERISDNSRHQRLRRAISTLRPGDKFVISENTKSRMGEKTFDGAVVAAHKRGATIQLINDNGVTISVISPSSNDADDARRRVVAGEVWLDPLQEQKEYQLPNLTHPDGKPRPGRAGLPDEARKKILSLLKRGVKTSEISRAVGVCRSTVNRMQASAVISEKPTALPTDPKDNLISESLNF